MQVQPYLTFNGDCEAALAFYGQVLGGQITFMMRFKDAPGTEPVDPAWADKIMHCNFSAGSTQFMAADCSPERASAKKSGFTMSVAVDTAAEGEKIFNGLAADGQITMPFQATFWTKGFGMLVDKFGTPWMVNCLEQPA
ncbi:VOC family protein [Silvimonas iriomotensis]|uniref:VOC family protein n=1 Tax=Silvimonas iriomotensis TaxID=449662 RepID=A0ABQ2PE92_9NEIS|nr:VOC family protein [Silvimonas iriomotensis]GGP23575.1 VOC family protein [Silvimonas iriomotensis]